MIAALTPAQLAGRSGASEWSVAQVLSHLGSGAEITLAGLEAATTGVDRRTDGFNQSVWDRWNALPPGEQASGFLDSDERLVSALEALPAETLDTTTIDLGFLPAPVPMSSFTGMRLSEAAQHAWDVRVALDPAATLASEAAQLLAEHFAGGLAFLLGFLGKADALAAPAVVDIEGAGFRIAVADGVTIVADGAATQATDATAATAVFVGELEAAVRLIAGRLTPTHTPAGVTVTGNVHLEDLRRVFPGF